MSDGPHKMPPAGAAGEFPLRRDDELPELRSLIRDRIPQLLAIDGMDGVGKTKGVARKLDLPVVSTDTYIVGNDRYLDGGLRLDDLRADLAKMQATTSVVVEGCCILEILHRIDRRPDLHVYVRHIDMEGRWRDEETVLGDSAAYLIEYEHRVTGEHGASQLAIDLINYHAKFRPWAKRRSDRHIAMVGWGAQRRA
ncbi:MAG: hypothetical protein WDN31_05340 [Hyphomicrobium sp.]